MTADPTNEFATSRRRGIVAFIGIAIALVTVGVASAAVLTVNEVESEFGLSDCLTKIEGNDGVVFGDDPAADFYINFDPTSVEVDPTTGVTTLQERLSVRAPVGHRTISTDTFRVKSNNCGTDFAVKLKADEATNTLGENTVGGDWSSKGVRLFISEQAVPPGNFDDAASWDQTPLIVNDAGAVINGLTGRPVLLDDSELRIGFELVGGPTAGDAGTLRFQVVFEPIATP